MFHQRYLQNWLVLLLAVYLIKAVVDPLRIFSTNYYNKYPKWSKMGQNVIKVQAIFSPTIFFQTY